MALGCNQFFAGHTETDTIGKSQWDIITIITTEHHY